MKGRVNISRIMHDYAEGDRVAIVLDGGQQMGMPHRRFQAEPDSSKATKPRLELLQLRTATCKRRCRKTRTPTTVGVIIMDDEGTFTDYASVRDMLLDAQDFVFLTYEQKAALLQKNADDNRNGYSTIKGVQ